MLHLTLVAVPISSLVIPFPALCTPCGFLSLLLSFHLLPLALLLVPNSTLVIPFRPPCTLIGSHLLSSHSICCLFHSYWFPSLLPPALLSVPPCTPIAVSISSLVIPFPAPCTPIGSRLLYTHSICGLLHSYWFPSLLQSFHSLHFALLLAPISSLVIPVAASCTLIEPHLFSSHSICCTFHSHWFMSSLAIPFAALCTSISSHLFSSHFICFLLNSYRLPSLLQSFHLLPLALLSVLISSLVILFAAPCSSISSSLL